jgi:hypothetical protein
MKNIKNTPRKKKIIKNTQKIFILTTYFHLKNTSGWTLV